VAEAHRLYDFSPSGNRNKGHNCSQGKLNKKSGSLKRTCHSEGATRSKSKSKKIKIKGDVPKPKATEESPVQASWKNQFGLETTKKQTVLLETKDSSSADHYLPNNKVGGWPPQNDKP
jgi:hypothetical protein